MKFIWLKSRSGEAPDLPLNRTLDRKDVIAIDSGEYPGSIAAHHHCLAIVVEVHDSNDTRRALTLIDEVREEYPVWIYQRLATVESTVSFMKAGASQVMTCPEEVERAMSSFGETSVVAIPAGRALIGTSRSILAVSLSIGLV